MAELRYGFGKNWAEFIETQLSDEIVQESADHLKRFMKVDTLQGKTFIDIGCGSGIHSLAALRLGAARVTAFDYDEDSVETSRQVRAWAGVPEDIWAISQGSVLDEAFMATLPKSDVEHLLAGGEVLEISCEYCKREYRIPPARLRGLLEVS